jgi:hypothetical protein
LASVPVGKEYSAFLWLTLSPMAWFISETFSPEFNGDKLKLAWDEGIKALNNRIERKDIKRILFIFLYDFFMC